MMRALLFLLLLGTPISLLPAQDTAITQRSPLPIQRGALPTTDPAKVGMSAATLAEAPQALQQLVDDGKVAGAIVTVARKGQIVLNQAVGFADLEAKKPMKTDSIVRIYSMTKPITSVGVMMLAEQGKLQLDDPISKYLPELANPKVYTGGEGDSAEFEPVDREVSVRDLLCHTSGYTYGFFGDSYVDKLYRKAMILGPFADLAATVVKIGQQPLLHQPGTQFNYSVSTDVLGRLIEIVSGQSLDQYFAEKIFAPLKMGDSGFFVPEDSVERFVNNYTVDDTGELKVGDHAANSRYRKRPRLLSGGGGGVSTAGDYIRFCQMVLNKGELEGARLLKPETVESMWKNQLPPTAPDIVMQGLRRKGVGFGLGFSVVYAETSAAAPVPVGELGWGGAASTHFWLSPQDDLAVVVMTQRQPFSFQAEAVVKPIVYRAIEK